MRALIINVVAKLVKASDCYLDLLEELVRDRW